jgi:hypothetical protein
MSKTAHYHETKIRPLVKIITGILKANPGAADDEKYMIACLSQAIPNFLDKSRCINCGASMAEYVREFDLFTALLLKDMAKVVRRNMQLGQDFTLANRISVSSEKFILHAAKCQTSRASKLGLIAKHKENNKPADGKWVITARGWAALRGEPVPRKVLVFRGKILDRGDEVVTMDEIFASYNKKVADMVSRKRSVKNDWRNECSDYNSNEWVVVGGIHQGTLI